MKQIKIKDKTVLIDEADWDIVKLHSWCCFKIGRTWYTRSWMHGKNVYLHRFLMQPPDSKALVDYIIPSDLNTLIKEKYGK